MAILGIVGLIGVAINDSIVVLSELNSNSDACQGNRKAIKEVTVGSTRHVLTTTVTTVAGFIPLLIDGGEFWPSFSYLRCWRCNGGYTFGFVFSTLCLFTCEKASKE